jgi:DNA-binding CsgD family transcriptional regulator
VYENSKALPFRRNAGRFDDAERAQPLYNADRLAIRLHSGHSLEKTATRTAMEYFGKAVAQLLECGSCYVAVTSHAAGSELEEARIGHATIEPSCAATVARIARRGAGANCVLLEPINARTSFVRKLIGSEPGEKRHSVIGRFPSGDAAVIFVAGWRPAALLPAEIPCITRAVSTMWETASALAQLSHQHTDAQIWLEELVFAALIVDEDLHIYEVNSTGRTLLTKSELLKADRGRLVGLSGFVTESLKDAIRETLISRAGQRWLTVPLATERQQFAFAKIGAVPAHCDARKVLVIVPEFDEVSGANGIATAFGLNWAEERIIARILQGQCPRHIGADLRLTEATVRTYTKRIMFKLGINRQSEFFLLYHLTQSPFGAGRRETSVGRGVLDSRLNKKAH